MRTRKKAIQKFSDDLLAIQNALNDTVVAKLLEEKASAIIKRKAASEDAEKIFGKAPIEGVGLESWKFMWEKARKYSEEVAYVEKQFPFIDDDALCVLCQQPLAEEARVRLVSV